MATLDAYPTVQDALARYEAATDQKASNATHIVKFCKKNGIDGITYSKVSKYLKLLSQNGQNTNTNHIKLKPSNDISQSSPTTNNSPLFNRSQTVAVSKHRELMISNKNIKMNGDDGNGNDDMENNKKHENSTQTMIISENIMNELNNNKTELKNNKNIAKTHTNKHNHNFNLENIKANSLIQKPWNKNKSPLWPKNRGKMTDELKQWLKKHRFQRFTEKLYYYGIETIADLRLLTTEDIIEELCGPERVRMTIIYRLKFIRSVMQMNAQNMPTKMNVIQLDLNSNTNGGNNNNKRRRPSIFAMSEKDAIGALSKKITESTGELKKSKTAMAVMDDQATKRKQEIKDDFDHLIAALQVRQRQLMRAVDLTKKNTQDLLQTQLKEITDNAKTLLIAQNQLSFQIRISEPSNERHESVVTQIHASLMDVSDVKVNENVNLIYEKGNGNGNDLSELILNYGKVSFNDNVVT